MKNVDEDEQWMRRCIGLATKGSGNVSPNPLVGAVIVRNGKLLGKGFHRKFGGAHAEINAIRDALRKHRSLEAATLYVNLEPCSHFGKTPPCTDAIIAHRFKRIVVAMEDPNPIVSGNGVRKLRAAGIEVAENVLQKDAERLNEAFVKFITRGLPFVTLKVAQTSDGFIARSDGRSRWITGRASPAVAHRLRSQYDAVLIGAGTAIADNPHLTVRHVAGRNPFRILVDGRLRTPLQAHLFTDRHRSLTIVYTTNQRKARQLQKKGIVVKVFRSKNATISLPKIMRDLASRNVASIMVEGGQQIYEQFLRRQLADKVMLFRSTKRFGKGIPAFGTMTGKFRLVNTALQKMESDVMEEGSVAYD
ncbi:MAG: bifunctional diaminohydroxyphosphoribosylaminopyrimidine deaminase/5-amino-6-(5-phosphoribosylamino)uracil reductase RibD [Bacteroidota bacterium]|nr:bifunctional diaminohydroxyphosphoribosylaminopyrimidine deaminase/5-amino-6-(5-phosphoribosylamino)uracil reductase RibD [Bacteroidota bacterium]